MKSRESLQTLLPAFDGVKVPTVFEGLRARFAGKKLVRECEKAERFAAQTVAHLESAPAKDAELRARMIHNARVNLADLRANLADLRQKGAE